MKWFRSTLLVLGIAACIAAPCAARAATSNASNLTLKLGVLFPSNADARDLGGDTQFAVGLDYRLSQAATSTSATSVYLDYLGGSKNSGSIHSTGFGVAFRSTGTGYIGAGIGIYSTSVQFDNDEDDVFRSNTSATGGGGKIFGGFNLASGIDLELDYHFLPSAGGVNPSGPAIEVGIRL